MEKPEYNQAGEYRRPDSHTCYDDTAVHIDSICEFNIKTANEMAIFFVSLWAKT